MVMQETIVAPATPPGEGGIGIVRLSGPEAEATLVRLFQPRKSLGAFVSHQLYYGHLHDCQGRLLDEVMAVVMRAPRSYTREDVVEVHCHGGSAVVNRIVAAVLQTGVRLARPGEFTERAFLNGRLDLAQAEGVIDLIRARTDAARALALGQVEGALSRQIHHFRQQIADTLAFIEATIDFPEEDLPAPAVSRLQGPVAEILLQMQGLQASFAEGRLLREGISLLLFGPPNAGKSSLLNALLGEERAIVTATPGTTRDIIEEGFSLEGIPLRLIDTAGVRQSDDPIEAEGVRRAQQQIKCADLVLLVLDGSCAPGTEARLALEACGAQRVLLVLNKADLGHPPIDPAFAHLPTVRVSVHTGAGLDRLRQEIVATFRTPTPSEGRETVLLTDLRHYQALVHCSEALQRFLQSLRDDLPPEFLALELGEALEALGEITGETTPEDILRQIFSRFCIGK